jgi:hypothetical protein
MSLTRATKNWCTCPMRAGSMKRTPSQVKRP